MLKVCERGAIASILAATNSSTNLKYGELDSHDRHFPQARQPWRPRCPILVGAAFASGGCRVDERAEREISPAA
jgi:hypothetical protein